MFDRLREELIARGLYDILHQTYLNLVAERIIYYVMSITDAKHFKEAYSYYKEVAEKKYYLLSNDSSFFHDKGVYEKLKLLSDDNPIEYLCENLKESKKNITGLNRLNWWLISTKRWTFPTRQIKRGATIIVYGFGDVGKDYCEEILDMGLFSLLGVIDKDAEVLRHDDPDIPFVTISEAVNMVFDYLIIAIANKDVANTVKSELKRQGIIDDKILWFDPIDMANRAVR